MSLGPVIDSLGGLTLTFTRTTASAYASGRLTYGTESQFSAVCGVQPISGRERLMFAESERTREMRVLFTRAELLARTPATEPDRVVIGGEVFEVVRVEKWDGFGETHCRAYVAKVDSP